jgi:biopolymer transport protein ExbD
MNLVRVTAVAVICLAVTTTGCRGRGAHPPAPAAPPGAPSTDSPSARIWIAKDGTIELNGKSVELDAVGAELADLAKRQGVVLYGRDAPEEEPHPIGMKVIELVVQNRLPIRMSTQRDFSDAVGPDGKVKQ